MSNARKFLFETEFAADGTVLRDPVRGEFQRFDAKEVESARGEAYEKGKGDALVQAERAAAAALEALANHAHAVVRRLDLVTQQLRTQATTIALAAARKIAGEALDAYGEARVLAAVEAAMEAMPTGARLVVRLAAQSEAALRPRLEAAAKARSFDGALIVRASESAARGDVEIDWSEGVIAVARGDVEARVEALIAAALAASAQEDATQDGSAQ